MTVIATGVTGTTFNDTGLLASIAYTYTVAGVNAAGTGVASNPASATTFAASAGLSLLTFFKTLGLNAAGVLSGQTLNIYSGTPLDAINSAHPSWASYPTVGIGSAQTA